MPRRPRCRASRSCSVAAKPLPEAAQNLAITLEHLDDPKYAVEKDPRSPRGGQGYTGLEAFLRYLFAQSLAINLYDGNNYMLKVALFLDNNCAPYRDAAAVRGNQALAYCRAILGPNQPGHRPARPDRARRAPREAAPRGQGRAAGAAGAHDGQARRAGQAGAARPDPRRDQAAAPGHPAPTPALTRSCPASAACRATTRSARTPSRSSTSCSAHEPPPRRIDHGQPRPRRGSHHARGRGGGLPRLQRQPRAAVRAHDLAEVPDRQRREPPARQRGARGRSAHRRRGRDAAGAPAERRDRVPRRR